MSQWKLVANGASNTSGPVQWVAYGLGQGSNNTNEQANNLSLVSNDTPGAVKTTIPGTKGTGWAGLQGDNYAVGQYAFTPAAYANGGGDSKKVPGGTGWVLRKAFEGPILSLTASNGANVANGESVTISGGSVNAVATLTTNATGNLTAATVVGNPGLFANATTGITVNFNKEEYVVKLNIGANSAAFTGLPAANTVVAVTISNTGNTFATGITGANAVGYFVANLATGITNTNLQTITWGAAQPGANGTGYWGLFSNNQTNTAVTISFAVQSNGLAIANGSAALSANLVTHGGSPSVAIGRLGGRAGRVQYETLVSTRFIANGGLANASNSSVYFPQ